LTWNDESKKSGARGGGPLATVRGSCEEGLEYVLYFKPPNCTHLVNVDLDVVSDVFHDHRVGGWEARLFAHFGGLHGLKQELCVDDRDAPERRARCVLPVVALDHEELQRIAGDGKLDQRTGLLLFVAVRVGEEYGDGDVDRLDARIDKRNHVWNLRVFVDVCTGVDLDKGRGLVGGEVLSNVDLCLMVLQEGHRSIHESRRECVEILFEMSDTLYFELNQSNTHLETAVEGVAGRLDALDCASVSLCDGIVVLRCNLHYAHGELRNLGKTIKGVLDLAQALFVHPVVQHVAGLQFKGNVVATRTLLAVVWYFFEGVELDGRDRSANELEKLLSAHILLVLLVRRRCPARREGAN